MSITSTVQSELGARRASLSMQISTAVVGKMLDVQKEMGASLLQLIEESAPAAPPSGNFDPKKGGNVDLYA